MHQQTPWTSRSHAESAVLPEFAFLSKTHENRCGHQQKASIRYFHNNDWVSLCLECWHRQRHLGGLLTPTKQPTEAARTLPTHTHLSESGHHRPFLDVLPSRIHHQPFRVMLYSHDTYGLGHLRRNLAIARRLLAFPDHFEVMLITGSPMQNSWPLPHGLTVRALPPVIKLGDEHYGPRDHAKNFALVKGHRQALILESTLAFRPDLFLVDHAPIGMGGELLPTLALLQEDYPETHLILGLRDIIDAPHATQDVWHEQGIYDILDRVYDAILVYGRKDWFDVITAYDMPASISHKIRYCGYICNESTTEDAGPALPQAVAGHHRILVTVGGGGDGIRIIEAYLSALRQNGDCKCQSLIVPGPLMDPVTRTNLEASVADIPETHLIDGATDMLPLMRQCDLIISMAGYNTSAELLSMGCKAILIPRAKPRAEQRLRAKMLAQLAFVDSVDPDSDMTEQLQRLIPLALTRKRQPHASFQVDGTSRVLAELHALAARSNAELTL